MADYLLRDQAPLLTLEQWQAIDRTVVDAARHHLVGRRFIPLFGPVGAGTQVIPEEVFPQIGPARVNMLGEESESVIQPTQRGYKKLPMIYKDFCLYWRDIETGRQLNLPLDLGAAASAAIYCAQAEDSLIFNGNPNLGLAGLLNVENRNTVPMSDWGNMGAAFSDVVAAVSKLTAAGFPEPYALVTSPYLYGNMFRVFDNTGLLEINQVKGLASAGVFLSTALPEASAVLVATGAENMDLVIGQDLTTAFLEVSGMNYLLRVFETLTLRIKRPQAICTIGGGTPQADSRRGGRQSS